MDFTKMAAKDMKRQRANSRKTSYKGIRVGGKYYSAEKGYGQFKPKPAGKKTTREKLAGGIKLAIL